MNKLEEEKKELISLIEWYRDEYHKLDFCHSNMIEKIKVSTNANELEMYWKITDGWLDNN